MWNSDLPYSLFKLMEEDNVIVAYKGEVTSEILSAVFPLIEIKMDQISEELRMKKRVFNVLVEMLQNLYHHASPYPYKTPKEKTILFFIGKKDGVYYIVTGNYVNKSQVQALKNKLDKINASTPEELKELYRKTLLEGEFSEKGGAGLGFIDIARKSQSKIDYAFYPCNEEYDYIMLRVKISQK